jgi:hypothetical protein
MKGGQANIVSAGGSFDLADEEGRAQLFARVGFLSFHFSV